MTVVSQNTPGPQEFENFCRQCYGKLLSRAYYFHSGQCQSLAEDLTQETFLKLWKAWSEKHEIIVNSPGYATTALARVAADYWRRHHGQDPRLTPDSDGTTESVEIGDSERIRDAVRKLPPRQRQVVFLTYYEGLSPAEAAQRMGIGAATAHNYRALAKRNLRRMLQETVNDEEGQDGR